MPNLGTFLLFVVAGCWAFDILTPHVLWGLVGIVFFWSAVQTLLERQWGFVSRDEHAAVKAENEKLRGQKEELAAQIETIQAGMAALQSAMAVVKNTGVPRVLAEQYIRAGRDTVLKLYLGERLKFNNLLDDYARRQQQAEPPTAQDPPWQSVIGVETNANYEDARAAYRRLVKSNHPDRATSDADRVTRTARLAEINAAWDRAEKHFGIIGAA